RHGLVRGLPKLKFEKDHLCLACAMGKSNKKPHKPKSKDTNQEKLYLLHMDLCGPMRVASVNEKKYILVIVDDYSRFTWVKCLRSKDAAPDFIIKFVKMIQKQLLPHVTPKIVPSYADLSFLHVFCALCYPTNDSENLGKLQPKADIDFDELTAMASEHSSSRPALHEMTPATISSGIVPNPSSSTPFVPPSRTNWDILCQPLFDELLTHPPSVDLPAPEVIILIDEVVAPVLAVSTSSPSSTIVDQDAPSPIAHMGNDSYFGIIIPEVHSDQSSSTDSIHTIIEAMQEGLNEFERLEVWELVPRPDKVMVITLKWIKVKFDEIGGILKNKARLVVRGYRQEEGIDFEESCYSSG
ncbi:retrovirus-related pol polyprotein from transposon TNT 1-94, partial [Tanacetum coccineum]